MKRFTLILILLVLLLTTQAAALETGCPDTALPDAAPKEPKLVAITFDDGPGPFTGELLDSLLLRGAKATFFVFSQKITEDTAPLLTRMRDEGHCIGSHTFSHVRLTSLNDEEIRRELAINDQVIMKLTGSRPELIRPPFGSYNDRVVSACRKPVILWSVDTHDWQLHKPEAVCRNILSCVQDGDIVLLHELEKSSFDGVIAAIDSMMEDGYSFVTVPELFERRGIELTAGHYYHHARPVKKGGNANAER